MSLELLPHELLLSIGELLSTQQDLNSLARSSRKLYTHVNTFLYQRNTKSRRISVLIWAAETGREVTAMRTLDAGAQIDTKTNHRDGPSSLHIACANGHLKVVSVLLTRNASIHITNSRGVTPLHTACLYKHAPVVELLLNHGAPISFPSNTQETALHYAIKAPNLHYVPYHSHRLLGPKCPPTSPHRKIPPPPVGCTLSTITLLLSHGANPLTRDLGGTNPAHLAAVHHDPEVRATMRHAALAAEKVNAKTRARAAAREKGRLEKERQEEERLVRQREGMEMKGGEGEKKKKKEKMVREGEESGAREMEAERRREERLVSGRQMWSRLRESAEKQDYCRDGSGGARSSKKDVSYSSSSWSPAVTTTTTTGCAHSSPVWLKKKGKGQCCGLCSKGCEKHSLQCPDCGLVACTMCKARCSLASLT